VCTTVLCSPERDCTVTDYNGSPITIQPQILIRFFLSLFNRHANKRARSFFLVSEFRSTASMVSVGLPMLATLRAGRPTGASVLSRGKKCSFLQIVGTPTRWVSREQMLRHATVNSPPNGLMLAKTPTK